MRERIVPITFSGSVVAKMNITCSGGSSTILSSALNLTLGGDQAERVLSDDAAAEDLEQLHRQAKALGLPTLTAMAETMDDALAHASRRRGR